MILRLKVQLPAPSNYAGEIRVIRIDTEKGVEKYGVALAAIYRRILTPFVTLMVFDQKLDAIDYATTLKAALLNIPVGEVTE